DGTNFASVVPFFCCDIGSTVMVELRISDAAGNTNSCMVEVETEDKLAPNIVCPADKTITCDDDTSTAFTGEAVATDNCSAVTITVNDISNTVDDCGEGQITRVFTATDAANNTTSCIQIITVENPDPFFINANNELDPNDDIVWPIDYTTNTCGQGLEPNQLQTPYNFPVIDEGLCNNIATTNEDQVLEFGAQDACLKILRKWIVIDWCQVGQNQDLTQPGPGIWHYTQVIKVVNSSAPVVTSFTGDEVIGNFDADCGSAFAAFEIEVDDDCSAAADILTTWEFSNGIAGTGLSASGAFPNGNYNLTFTINDQCGNITTFVHDFEVKDLKPPTPVCIFGIATVTMPSSGSVLVVATDFESGSSYDNCTDYADLHFSFSEDIMDDSLVINCADIPADGLVPVSIYVTDAEGNADFCTTFVNVQDPTQNCQGLIGPTFIGTIETEEQVGIEDVTVYAINKITGDTLYNSITSYPDGSYYFYNFSGEAFDIVPTKDVNHLNGVTTFDLVLIAKHILGVELLDSPYKWIAADANHSETITTLDIVKLRSLILHIDDDLSDNTSWRFVPESYVFQNTTNPLADDFPEFITVEGNFITENFIAVKIGDVNGTALPNALHQSETRNYDGTVAFELENKSFAAGESVRVDLYANDFKNIEGYQFALEFDPSALDFIEVVEHLQILDENNFGLEKIADGKIFTSWSRGEAQSLENDDVLFSIAFNAKRAGHFSDVLWLNANAMPAEAYAPNQFLEVGLSFKNEEKSKVALELLQNTPNPFKAETTIGFYLPDRERVVLKFFTTSGNLVRAVEVNGVKGFNTLVISKEMLGAGVFYYQLHTSNGILVKKMVLLDQ
ncbi:MAG: cohesin domain-containing protein, partial [Bacteroidota bacterium]